MADAAEAPPRRELPTDPWTLAPMGPAFDEALADGMAALGLDDTAASSPAARRSYEAHARLLREWSAAINLTAIREPTQVARRHVCDSLSAMPTLVELLSPQAALLDLGSGAGYPGLPLLAALPIVRLGLLDSVAKKARFLAVAGGAVLAALPESQAIVEAIAERAEDLAEEPEHREAWDIVTARAVGSLAEVLELAMPLTREGGVVVAWKREEERGGLVAELREAGSIMRALGGGRPRVVSVDVDFLPGHRLVIAPKERPTPASYPRPPGVRRKRRR